MNISMINKKTIALSQEIEEKHKTLKQIKGTRQRTTVQGQIRQIGLKQSYIFIKPPKLDDNKDTAQVYFVHVAKNIKVFATKKGKKPFRKVLTEDSKEIDVTQIQKAITYHFSDSPITFIVPNTTSTRTQNKTQSRTTPTKKANASTASIKTPSTTQSKVELVAKPVEVDQGRLEAVNSADDLAREKQVLEQKPSTTQQMDALLKTIQKTLKEGNNATLVGKQLVVTFGQFTVDEVLHTISRQKGSSLQILVTDTTTQTAKEYKLTTWEYLAKISNPEFNPKKPLKRPNPYTIFNIEDHLPDYAKTSFTGKSPNAQLQMARNTFETLTPFKCSRTFRVGVHSEHFSSEGYQGTEVQGTGAIQGLQTIHRSKLGVRTTSSDTLTHKVMERMSKLKTLGSGMIIHFLLYGEPLYVPTKPDGSKAIKDDKLAEPHQKLVPFAFTVYSETQEDLNYMEYLIKVMGSVPEEESEQNNKALFPLFYFDELESSDYRSETSSYVLQLWQQSQENVGAFITSLIQEELDTPTVIKAVKTLEKLDLTDEEKQTLEEKRGFMVTTT